MLYCRLSELYGKDDKEDRDDESGIPGIQGKNFCGHCMVPDCCFIHCMSVRQSMDLYVPVGLLAT